MERLDDERLASSAPLFQETDTVPQPKLPVRTQNSERYSCLISFQTRPAAYFRSTHEAAQALGITYDINSAEYIYRLKEKGHNPKGLNPHFGT